MTNLLEAVSAWHQAQQTLKDATVRERELRDIVTNLATNGVFKAGTTNVELPDGWKLKVVQKLNQTVDATVFGIVRERLLEAGVMVDRLVTWKPSLSASEYKHLSDDQKAVADEMITSKPGAPTVELVPPK